MSKRKALRSKNAGSGKASDDTLINLVDVKENAQNMMQGSQLKVLGGVAIAALLLAGFLAYNYLYKAPKNTAAMEQMFKAETQFKQDSFALALENPGGGYDGFLDIIDNYNGTKAANLSKYYAGICYLNLGRFDDAIEYLSAYNETGSVTPVTKYGALGDAYSEKNDLESALGFYRKAANAGDNILLTPYYLMKLGMLLEHSGDSDGALKAYTQIKEKYPKSNEGLEIAKYIAKLAG